MKIPPAKGKWLCLLLVVVTLASCATYYERSSDLLSAVYSGKMDEAEKILDKPFWKKKQKNVLLYYLNKGVVLWMNNKHQESNTFFQQADFYIEDYQTNYAAGTISFLTNPKFTPYYGEGFEHILLHYYATLNYLALGKTDEALVECKRMQLKLTRITDFYTGKNKYKRDAFAHNLMGMIYDAQHDYNNAFIAYRNAYEIYRDDYAGMLKTPVPLQLKKDLIRAAYLTGFNREAKEYEKDFGYTYHSDSADHGSLVFFWNNGLGPVKDEWSINFTVVPQGRGWVRLVNWDLNLSFPFYIGEDKDRSKNLSGVKFIRVAFPKYVSREPYFQTATLTADSFQVTSKLDLSEDINAIAFRSLEDRMLKEMSEALIRVALKQAAEEQLRKESQEWGAALSVLNAITEQADTRNWQLLPYSINYTRVSLPPGRRTVNLVATSRTGERVAYPFTFDIRKGRTQFGSYQSLKLAGYIIPPTVIQ